MEGKNTHAWRPRIRLALHVVFAAAALNLTRYSPEVALFLDGVVEKMSTLMPRWLAHVIFFSLISAVIFLIAVSPIGTWLGNRWSRLERNAARSLATRIGSEPRYVYEVYEDRKTRELRRDVVRSLSRTSTVHGLFLSAQSLVTREGYVVDGLLANSMVGRSETDTRFLLLDPDSVYWLETMQHVAAATSVGVDTLRKRHEEAIRQLSRTIPGAKIAYHSQRPTWWLLILDDTLYAGRYGMTATDPSVSRTPIIGFPRSHPMYAWLADEYLSLAPPAWRAELSERQRR